MKKFLLIVIILLLSSPAVRSFDTYPRNYGIDVLGYTFNFTLSDDSNIIEGMAVLEILFKEAGISSLRLDFIKKSDKLEGKGMTVHKVLQSGAELVFNHGPDVLMITLDHPSVKGERIQIRISYSGIPASGLKIGPNKYGDRTFFSDNWPNRARHWLPTVDHPYDKATCTFIVTAPGHYQVISNGLKIEESNLPAQAGQGGNFRRTVWSQSVPICTWLFVLGVAEFAVQYYDTFEGISLQTWVYKQDRG